jgi:hypothetical protein
MSVNLTNEWQTETYQSGKRIIVHARRDNTLKSSVRTHSRSVRTEAALRRAITSTNAWCAKKNAKESATRQTLDGVIVRAAA